MDGTALLFAGHQFDQPQAKTAHGLIRGGDRYRVIAVLDQPHAQASADAGEVLDGHARGIPFVSSLADFHAQFPQGADYLVLGVANAGGRIDPSWRPLIEEALQASISVVNGLHEFLSDDAALRALATSNGARLIDVRKPKPKAEQHFWCGRIDEVRCPKIAVLGTDCAVGKRTTTRLLTEACTAQGRRAEWIYTGQTGWMQGGRYGFILDSTLNDFVGGELEHAIVTCWEDTQPELIFMEGQAALRNPSGPCGAEFLVSGQADGVVLVHPPGRIYHKGWQHRGRKLAPLAQEVALIQAFGSLVLGIALNDSGLSESEARDWQQRYREELNLPVVRPLAEGVSGLLPYLPPFPPS
jgi:uncharacterized NAD-dependent epimerase/dehydratase family protein